MDEIKAKYIKYFTGTLAFSLLWYKYLIYQRFKPNKIFSKLLAQIYNPAALSLSADLTRKGIVIKQIFLAFLSTIFFFCEHFYTFLGLIRNQRAPSIINNVQYIYYNKKNRWRKDRCWQINEWGLM